MFIAIVLGVIGNAAAWADTCSGTGCISTISEINTKINGDILIGTPFNEKLANCTPVADIYFVLSSGTNSDKAYSSILSAYISGKKIQLRIVEGSTNCEIDYVRFSEDF
ncbi:MAG: hypothetical protein GY820_03785 [Gammaproteobacteria bacterium]|nr:hypothetical protein [Gammaproteobacteria bacterium]